MSKFNITITYLIAFLPIILFGQTSVFKDSTIVVDHYKTKKFDCAIFPDNYKKNSLGLPFTPTRQDIDKAEVALFEKFKKNMIHHSRFCRNSITHNNLKKFKRQYFGYIDKDGQKILFINCFWADIKNEYWLNDRAPQSTEGGCIYSWRIKFILNTGTLFDLEIDGWS